MDKKLNINSYGIIALMGINAWALQMVHQITNQVSTVVEQIVAVKETTSRLDRDMLELRIRVGQCEVEIAKLKK